MIKTDRNREKRERERERPQELMIMRMRNEDGEENKVNLLDKEYFISEDETQIRTIKCD